MPSQHDLYLQECIDLFARQLVEALHADGKTLKQAIDERLVNENTAERRKLLSTLGERLDASWRPFCEKFHERLVEEALLKAGLIELQDDDAGEDFAGLKLVDDEQMESDLALAGFGSRVMAAVGDVLGDFAGRVNSLARRPSGDEELRNPLDAPVLVAALTRALNVVTPEADLRRMFLVILGPVLSALLKKEFTEARDWLAEQGVEPIQRVRQSGPRAGVAAGSEATPEGVMGMLQQFLQNAGGGAGSEGGAGGQGGQGGQSLGGGMMAVPAALLESLNKLQSLDLSVLQSSSPLDTSTTNVLRDLRQHEAVRSLPPIEAVTIDIVATMFDFIFDDSLVPDSVKALVGRMQIPLLKVAMLDKSFFSNKEHPARALLNEISRASIAAGKDLSQGDPTFEKIKAVVNRVLAESEKEQGVFAELLPEMKGLVADQVARGDQLAEKSKQVAEQQEQSEIADTAAGEAFVRILEGGINDDVPPHIADFLTRKYPMIMKRALLGGGTGGVAWALATQTLSDLLWTMTPKATPEERQRMVSLLPDLLRRLHAFLDKVGVPPEEKEPFIDALAQQHSRVIKGIRKIVEKKAIGGSKDGAKPGGEAVDTRPLALAAAGSVTSQNLAPTVVVTRIVQEDGVEIETMSVSGRAAGSRPVRNINVSAIKRGDWVEFMAENGESLRARLSWTSPARGVMLFTNPQTAKAVSISPEAMAIQLKRGQAKILGDDPMIERALTKLDAIKAA